MLHIFNPDRIVIGGSVWMHAQDLLEATMWETIRSRLPIAGILAAIEHCLAAPGDDVGLLGAVALAHDGLSGHRVA